MLFLEFFEREYLFTYSFVITWLLQNCMYELFGASVEPDRGGFFFLNWSTIILGEMLPKSTILHVLLQFRSWNELLKIFSVLLTKLEKPFK